MGEPKVPPIYIIKGGLSSRETPHEQVFTPPTGAEPPMIRGLKPPTHWGVRGLAPNNPNVTKVIAILGGSGGLPPDNSRISFPKKFLKRRSYATRISPPRSLELGYFLSRETPPECPQKAPGETSSGGHRGDILSSKKKALAAQ